MRILVALLALSTPAEADSHGVALEGQVVDVQGGQVIAFGPAAMATLGAGRVQLLVEGGVGMLGATEPSDRLGFYGTARVGGRLLAASLGPARAEGMDVQLLLDAGLGGERYWLDGAAGVNRPYVFFGWGTHLAGAHHAFAFDLRLTASPPLDDPAALRVLCRGTCTGPRDASVDLAIDFLIGVVAW